MGAEPPGDAVSERSARSEPDLFRGVLMLVLAAAGTGLLAFSLSAYSRPPIGALPLNVFIVTWFAETYRGHFPWLVPLALAGSALAIAVGAYWLATVPFDPLELVGGIGLVALAVFRTFVLVRHLLQGASLVI